MFEEYVGTKVKVVYKENQIRFIKGTLHTIKDGFIQIDGIHDNRTFTIKIDAIISMSPMKEGYGG